MKLKNRIVICVLGIVLCGCSGSTPHPATEHVNILPNHSWQQQLAQLRDNGHLTKYSSGLSLISFTEKGRIASEGDVLTLVHTLFDTQSYHVFFAGTPQFRIMTLQEYKTYLQERADPAVPLDSLWDRMDHLYWRLEDLLSQHFEVGMGLVQLVWDYHGKQIPSIAVVSPDKGVVYDNIGSFVVNPVYEYHERWSVDDSVRIREQYPSILTKTWTELPEPYIRHSAWKTRNVNIFGELAYDVIVGCRSVFTRDGRYLDAQIFADYIVSPGWFCHVETETLQSIPLASMLHRLRWRCRISQFPLPLPENLGIIEESVYSFQDTIQHEIYNGIQ